METHSHDETVQYRLSGCQYWWGQENQREEECQYWIDVSDDGLDDSVINSAVGTGKQQYLWDLSEKFGIELNSYSEFITKTTPGTFLRVCECLERSKIDETKNLYDSTEILLDKFKKDKNEIYLEAIKFLLDIQVDKSLKRKKYDF